MLQYWATLATRLRHLEVFFGGDLPEDISLQLSQLSNLCSLKLHGGDEDMGGRVFNGHIRLHLPMLKSVCLFSFENATVSLDCPKLAHLSLEDLCPLQAFSGAPCNLQSLTLQGLGAESVPLEAIFTSQRLGKLNKLEITDCPGDPRNVSTCCFSSNLTSLRTSCDLGVLFPTKAPWEGLPFSLIVLDIMMPMERGIPLVLEQLTNLERQSISTLTCRDPMHLDRPLDALLNLPRLKSLIFGGDWMYRRLLTHDYDIMVDRHSNWTAPALVLLGLAQKHVLDMQRAPGGRKVDLSY